MSRKGWWWKPSAKGVRAPDLPDDKVIAFYRLRAAGGVGLVTQAGLGENGAKLEQMTFRTVARRLLDLRVPLYLHSQVLEITERAVIMTLGDNIFPLEADSVVLAVGMKRENQLARELEGVVPELYTLGDCVHPRDAAMVSVRAGELAARI